MTTVAIVQARMTSRRLPGKVLLPLGQGTILDSVISRVQAAGNIDMVAVAAPDGAAHDAIPESLADRSGVIVTRGSETNVLARFLAAARKTNADIIVRVTSDCPMIDPKIISSVVAARHASQVPYASTALECGYPLGMDVEAITRDALETAGLETTDEYELEHVTPFLWRRPNRFPALYLDRKPDLRMLRLAIDTSEDYTLALNVWKHLGNDPLFGLEQILALREEKPNLFGVNAQVLQTPYATLGSLQEPQK